MYLVYTHIFFYSGDFGISKVMSTRGKEAHTGKSLSEVLLFAEHGENMCTNKNCSERQKQFLYTTCSPQV